MVEKVKQNLRAAAADVIIDNKNKSPNHFFFKHCQSNINPRTEAYGSKPEQGIGVKG
jgi:hypothetical protein